MLTFCSYRNYVSSYLGIQDEKQFKRRVLWRHETESQLFKRFQELKPKTAGQSNNTMRDDIDARVSRDFGGADAVATWLNKRFPVL